jgi:hypothetical protein
MSPDNPSSTLPDHVERIAASVVGLATRRHRASALVWRDGVAVASAAMLWRHPRVSIAFPNGEQADGEVRGIDGGTDLAVVTFAGVTVAVAERSPAPMPRSATPSSRSAAIRRGRCTRASATSARSAANGAPGAAAASSS